MKSFRVETVWIAGQLERDQTVVVDSYGEIQTVRPGDDLDGEPLKGLLLPGLINAHLHLELSWMKGGVLSNKSGLVEWVERQLHFRSQSPSSEECASLAKKYAEQMFEQGTAGVFDISNGNQTARTLAEAGLSGLVQHELLTMDRGRLPKVLAEVENRRPTVRLEKSEIRVRPGPHALYSTAPQLLRASVEADLESPFSIHVGESEEEVAFVSDGRGPLADFLDCLGVDWRWWDPVGLPLVNYLDALGLLGPQTLLVHGVLLSEAELKLAASREASLCLCPRSNRWISGLLPNIQAAIDAGCRLCIGTDSLASNDDLDLFEELAELGRSFPEIGMERWLSAVTENGADFLGLANLGRIEPGRSPGLLLLPETTDLDSLRVGPPPSRRWLVTPGRGYV